MTEGPVLLSIDDEAPIRESIQAYFEDVGFTVHTAPDGASGLAAIQSCRPDAVLLDLRMPDIDGLEVLAQIVRYDPTIPVIVVSGAGMLRDAVDSIKLGAWDYVTKPILDLEVLEHAVRRTLERAALIRENEMYRLHLETQVEARTAELAAANLRLRQEMAEREAAERQKAALERSLFQAQKLESIGRLTSGIAHDFNNVLTGILGYAEIATRQQGNPTAASDALAMIQEAGRRAADLTRQLLAFSRRQRLSIRVARPNAVVLETVRLLDRLLGPDIQLELQLAEGLDNIRADVGQLQQALINLVVNARDAMPAGGRLLLATAPGGGPAEMVFAVSDTGGGIPSDIQSQIFEPFFTTKEEGKGTGLGLATVLGIVQQHGGRIELESEAGRGTTFRIHLPTTGEPVSGPQPELRPVLGQGRGTILAVDDDLLVRRLIADGLSPLGFSVLVAASAAEARAMACATAGIDCLLLDVVLPDGHGPELAAELRRCHPQARLLLISGHPERLDPVLFPAAGTALLAKPFLPSQLAATIRTLLTQPA
ncbi:MAG: response regulator [Thermodesulfobacteriota bacterium]